MSIANVRQHWRFLVKVVLIFLTVIVIGPMILFGIGSFLYGITSPLGPGNIVIVGIAMAMVTLGWLFFVLWLGNRGADNSGECDR